MGKNILAGLWVFAVTIMSVYFGRPAHLSSDDAATKAPPVELLRLKPITVPVVDAGGIEGYLLAVIGYNIDRAKLADPAIAIDAIIQDESFRTLYGVDAVKYKKPRKSDLAEISKSLQDGVNRRFGADLVKEVLMEELSFIPKEKARSGRGG